MLATTKDRVYEIENENPTEELMDNDPMKQLVDIGQVEEPLEEPVDQSLALQTKDEDPVEEPINTNSEFANRAVKENIQEKNPAAVSVRKECDQQYPVEELTSKGTNGTEEGLGELHENNEAARKDSDQQMTAEKPKSGESRKVDVSTF